MRKDEIISSAVNVKPHPQILQGHRRTFNVPARPSLPPWAVPTRLSRFRAFPQGKICRMPLEFPGLDPRPSPQFPRQLPGQFAILGQLRHLEIHIALRMIGVAPFDQSFNHLDHLRNMLAGPEMIEMIERLIERGYAYHRSEEHTSELQSQSNLVCRLLLEKKKNNNSSTM